MALMLFPLSIKYHSHAYIAQILPLPATARSRRSNVINIFSALTEKKRASDDKFRKLVRHDLKELGKLFKKTVTKF